MREKRLSTFVFVFFFEGRRYRGSVAKLENRGSLIEFEGAADAAPLGAFCFGILVVKKVEVGAFESQS
jgi:hypothetical protein